MSIYNKESPHFGSVEVYKEKNPLLYKFATSKAILTGIVAWVVVGFIGWVLIVLGYQTWTTAIIGPAVSAQRVFWALIGDLLWAPPLVALAWRIHFGRPAWTAPKGRWVPGKYYPIFSPYNVVGIAVMVASVTALAGTTYTGVPLTDLAWFLGVMWFGPVVGTIAGVFAPWTRSAVWGVYPGWPPPNWMLIEMVSMSSIPIFYWLLVEGARAKGKSLYPPMIVAMVLTNLEQRFVASVLTDVIEYPIPALYASFAGQISRAITDIVVYLIAFLAAEAVLATVVGTKREQKARAQ